MRKSFAHGPPEQLRLLRTLVYLGTQCVQYWYLSQPNKHDSAISNRSMRVTSQTLRLLVGPDDKLNCNR